MCGLVGIADLRGTREIDRALLTAMNDVIAHRGPDGDGIHLGPGVGLGHRRLAIIDVAAGQQPLTNEDGQVIVVFNGEIYNFQELVPELEALGHRFRTHSDTEVIVHGWEAWGPACVERFRGMFAFALWDRKQQTLFLARDRLGVKPLFWASLPDGQIAFASELKSLEQLPQLDRTIEPEALESYFALGYVAEPRTIYRGAHKLSSGCSLLWRRGDAAPQIHRWWDAKFTTDSKISAQEAREELVRRLTESIKLRMISEVPLGAFLSGGVDSSTVVALMAGLSNGPVRTCAIGFDDPKYNEVEFAQQVADRYQTDHSVQTVKSDDFDLIDTLAWAYDEPYADSSAIPTYRVCQMARQRVTVALSGDGGDETFGGYRRYKLHMMEERMRGSLPLGLRKPVFGLLGQVYPKADWAPRVFRAKTTFQAMARDSVGAYFHTMSYLRDDERMRLYSPTFKTRLNGWRASEVFHEHAQRAQIDDPLALIQYLDYQTYLVGDINTKVDRASMAHSLEVREPLMDHPLVEWLATLPSHLKLRGQEGKWLLKTAMEPHLPHDVLYRPKMGFAVPLERWFRGPLKQRIFDALTGPRLNDTGLFDPKELRRLVESHQSGRRDYSAPLWSLLMFDAFLKRIHGDASKERAA